MALWMLRRLPAPWFFPVHTLLLLLQLRPPLPPRLACYPESRNYWQCHQAFYPLPVVESLPDTSCMYEYCTRCLQVALHSPLITACRPISYMMYTESAAIPCCILHMPVHETLTLHLHRPSALSSRHSHSNLWPTNSCSPSGHPTNFFP